MRAPHELAPHRAGVCVHFGPCRRSVGLDAPDAAKQKLEEGVPADKNARMPPRRKALFLCIAFESLWKTEERGAKKP